MVEPLKRLLFFLDLERCAFFRDWEAEDGYRYGDAEVVRAGDVVRDVGWERTFLSGNVEDGGADAVVRARFDEGSEEGERIGDLDRSGFDSAKLQLHLYSYLQSFKVFNGGFFKFDLQGNINGDAE
ncbi:hypothetical protein QQ045_018440 [Rhodiola kirilowii]